MCATHLVLASGRACHARPRQRMLIGRWLVSGNFDRFGSLPYALPFGPSGHLFTRCVEEWAFSSVSVIKRNSLLLEALALRDRQRERPNGRVQHVNRERVFGRELGHSLDLRVDLLPPLGKRHTVGSENNPI